MDFQTLYNISIFLLSVCIVLLIASVYIFLKFRIKNIINDLSGKTAQKQIEKFREENSKTGYKKFKPSPVNIERGRITENVDNQQVTVKPAPIKSTVAVTSTKDIPTDVLVEEKAEKKTDVLTDSTDLLNITETLPSNGIEVTGNETDVLNDETEVLGNETDILGNKSDFKTNKSDFKIIKSIISVNTEEVI